MKEVSQIKKALMALYLPFMVLIAVLLTSVVANIARQFMSVQFITVISSLNFVLGIMGLISILGMIIGFILGLIFIIQSGQQQYSSIDERSGKGSQSVVPPEVKGWNWGAAGLTWFWGINAHVWVAFLTWIPLIGPLFAFVLGYKGSEWAWKSRRWPSVDYFQTVQNTWRNWGIFVFLISLIPMLTSLYALFDMLFS